METVASNLSASYCGSSNSTPPLLGAATVARFAPHTAVHLLWFGMPWWSLAATPPPSLQSPMAWAASSNMLIWLPKPPPPPSCARKYPPNGVDYELSPQISGIAILAAVGVGMVEPELDVVRKLVGMDEIKPARLSIPDLSRNQSTPSPINIKSFSPPPPLACNQS